jgi:hypothetical protein
VQGIVGKERLVTCSSAVLPSPSRVYALLFRVLAGLAASAVQQATQTSQTLSPLCLGATTTS